MSVGDTAACHATAVERIVAGRADTGAAVDRSSAATSAASVDGGNSAAIRAQEAASYARQRANDLHA